MFSKTCFVVKLEKKNLVFCGEQAREKGAVEAREAESFVSWDLVPFPWNSPMRCLLDGKPGQVSF